MLSVNPPEFEAMYTFAASVWIWKVSGKHHHGRARVWLNFTFIDNFNIYKGGISDHYNSDYWDQKFSYGKCKYLNSVCLYIRKKLQCSFHYFNFLKRVTFPSREERLKKVKSEIAQASKKKKGFMTPERKKKLRVSYHHLWADSWCKNKHIS